MCKMDEILYNFLSFRIYKKYICMSREENESTRPEYNYGIYKTCLSVSVLSSLIQPNGVRAVHTSGKQTT